MYMYRPYQEGGLLCTYFNVIKRVYVPNVPFFLLQILKDHSTICGIS